MASIIEEKEKMTIFYSKLDGGIMFFCTGIQDMDFFGDRKEEFSMICDYIVTESDTYVLENIDKFRVQDGKIKFNSKLNLAKYM